MRWLWLLVAVGALACGAPEPTGEGGAAPDAERTDAPRTPAPAFALPDLSGTPVKLADFGGRTVVLDFWATWCPPCIYQIPVLNQLQAAHADAGDLTVIGVSVDIDGAEVVGPFVEEHGVEYTIVLGDEDLAREFGAQGFPAMAVVSPDGTIDSMHHGVVDYDDLEELVATAAQQRASGPDSSR